MPNYKLTYFALKGKAEPIRLLLSYGGVEFEDNRINRDSWPALKSTCPLGQLPILEIDGTVMYQSLAICRYLGRLFNIYGDNAWEAAQIDIVVDTISEFRQKLHDMNKEPDPILKQKKFDELTKTIVPFYLEKLDAMAKENDGHLANKKLSWADIYFYGVLDSLNYFSKSNIREKYKNLDAVAEFCFNITNIRKWIAHRPETPY